jgi:prepilin-type processing-associated H-X9-DG protein
LRTISRLASYVVENEPVQRKPSSEAELLMAVEAISKEHEAQDTASEPLAYPSSLSSYPRAPREQAESRYVGGRFRLDWLVACGIGLFAVGFVGSGIGNLRAHREMLACKDTLRTLHNGLSGYADNNNGKYPQVNAGSPAESFATTLVNAGQVPEGFRPACPSTRGQDHSKPIPAVGYTYSLGYKTPGGNLVGLTRPKDTPSEHDLLPISADYPTAQAAPALGPLCPHNRGMNVLYVGGHVRNTTTPLIGPNGDHIFQNIYGSVEAGADRSDVVLGRPGDRP